MPTSISETGAISRMVLRWIPATRAGAERLGFVTPPQMVRALIRAVESPARDVRVVEVPEIRRA